MSSLKSVLFCIHTAKNLSDLIVRAQLPWHISTCQHVRYLSGILLIWLRWIKTGWTAALGIRSSYAEPNQIKVEHYTDKIFTFFNSRYFGFLMFIFKLHFKITVLQSFGTFLSKHECNYSWNFLWWCSMVGGEERPQSQNIDVWQ